METAEAKVLQEAPTSEASTGGNQKQERERSTIEFPYLTLEVATEITKAVHARGGSRAGFDEVAAHIGESAKGSAFRNKVTTARSFGLATYSNGTITLTPLGSRLADPDQEKAAKAEAFLSVPLYKRLYDDFKGSVLPPTNAGLETVIEGLGVSTKQKDKARQAFQRSAQQAGFFAYGTTKLVYPTLAATSGSTTKPKVEEEEREHEREDKGKKGGNNGGDGGSQHPLIDGLLKELPVPKTEWPMEERKNWLEMASTIFNVIYKNSDDSRGSLRVVVEKSPAK
jgi:hypothetical protein